MGTTVVNSAINSMELVKSFFDAWNKMDFNQVFEMLSNNIVYHNIPMEPLVGKAAVKEFVSGFGSLEEIDKHIVNIAQSETCVLTERVDKFTVKGNKVAVPVMGVFEVADGLILTWRDYFDLKSFTDQLPQ